MSKLESWNQTKGDRKSEIKNQNTLDLDNIRSEIQKIIDNHWGWLSVMDYGPDDLILIIDVLRWNKIVYEKEYNKKIDELKKIYDDIVNEHNRIIKLDNLNRDIWTDLSQIKADILLWEKIEKIQLLCI